MKSLNFNTKLNYLISSLLLLCFSLLISSCAALLGLGGDSGSTYPDPVPPYEEGSGIVEFTILQLNDVYEISPLEKGKVGGMARVATVKNELLDENYNLMTVLAGDFLSPSLIGTLKYEDKRIQGRQMVEVMNELGVGLVAFGNHEFDIKESELQDRMNESYFEWLGTNVLHQNGKKLEPFYKESYGFKYYTPETYVWEITDYMTGGTVKVGFYSATINSNLKDWVYYEDPFMEAQKAYLELAGKADIIIGLTHLELEQDLKLAAMLPNTKLIMGGHEHENHIDTVGNVIITKADANAKSVYIHRFSYDPIAKTVSLNSELKFITDEIEDDPTLDIVVERWNKIQDDRISEVVSNPSEVIFNAAEPLDGREKSVRNFQTNLGGIIAASMSKAAKKPVDCAFFNGGSIRLDDQLSGEITTVDIFRALPFGGSIVEVEMKGSLLKQVLNAGMENKGLGGYLQWHNVAYNEKSKSWSIGGKPLSDSKIYRVATSDFLFGGKESRIEFFTKDNKNVVKWEAAKEGDAADVRSDIRKAVVAFLKTM